MRKRKPNTLALDQRFAVTIDHTAAALDCSRTKVYDLKNNGLLEFVYLGGMTRVTTRSLRKLVGESEKNA
jgi:hypothetical protein